MSNYLADGSYLAVKPQADASTPITPTDFVPLISESVRINPNISADRRMKGLDWKSDDVLKGPKMVEGDIEIFADPDNLGHLLNMTYLKGVTTGDAASGYTHPFTVGGGDSYSIEISRGVYAQRIWGVRADNLKISFRDNKMVATASIKGLGQFYSVSLSAALTGAGMTHADFDTSSSLRPAEGLVAGDVVVIGGVDITITAVDADYQGITFASTTVTASIGDPVVLKAQTPSYTGLVEPLYLGNTLVGIAATEALATTAAASKATASPCYNLGFNLKNNLLDGPASGSDGPSVLINQTREADLEMDRLFEDPTQHRKWIEMTKQAATMITKGRPIKSDFSTWEQLSVKFHKIKLTENAEPLEVGQYIFDKQKFEALYDSGDGAAVVISLINRTAGTDY